MTIIILCLQDKMFLCTIINNLTTMNKLSLLFALAFMIVSCGDKKEKTSDDATTSTEQTTSSDPSTYDPTRGEGKYSEVDLGTGIDLKMAKHGEEVASVKCMSCHKLTDERLVGPGWKGVTKRQTPAWIMNFITNPDPMIDKDPELQAQLELCLVRMPNQSLQDNEARSILEFMRENDETK